LAPTDWAKQQVPVVPGINPDGDRLRPGIPFAARFLESAALNAVPRLSGSTRRACLNEKTLWQFNRAIIWRHPR